MKIKNKDYLPLFIDFTNKDILIVGNSGATEKKIRQFLDAGANVFVVSPQPLPLTYKLNIQGKIKYRQGAFEEKDLENKWMVIGTIRDALLAEFVFKTAEKHRIFCNILDDKSHCSFIFPAILKRGMLRIAISTCGASPALAVKLKEKLDNCIEEEYAPFTEILGELRQEIMNKISDWKKRTELFHELANLDTIELLKDNGKQYTRDFLHLFIRRYITEIEN